MFSSFRLGITQISTAAIGGIFTQALALATNIAILRLLPEEHYALLTITLATVGTISVLSDSGVGSGLLALAGQRWKDKDEMGRLLAAATYLRKRMLAFGALIGLPSLAYLLLTHTDNWLLALFLTLSGFAVCVLTLATSIYSVTPQLHGAVFLLTRASLYATLFRLILTIPLLLIYPNALTVVLVMLFSLVIPLQVTRHFSASHATLGLQGAPEDIASILSTVKRIAPSAVYFSFSSQITTWILSLFGTTSAVAQIGGLGRLGQLFSVFNSVITTVIAPRTASFEKQRQIGGLLAATCLAVFGVALVPFAVSLFWPWPFLLILGPSFSSLTVDVSLVLLTSAIGVFYATLSSMNVARSWITPPLLLISVSIASQAACLMLLPIWTLRGAVLMGLVCSICSLLLLVGYTLSRLVKAHRPPENSLIP